MTRGKRTRSAKVRAINPKNQERPRWTAKTNEGPSRALRLEHHNCSTKQYRYHDFYGAYGITLTRSMNSILSPRITCSPLSFSPGTIAYWALPTNFRKLLTLSTTINIVAKKKRDKSSAQYKIKNSGIRKKGSLITGSTVDQLLSETSLLFLQYLNHSGPFKNFLM